MAETNNRAVRPGTHRSSARSSRLFIFRQPDSRYRLHWNSAAQVRLHTGGFFVSIDSRGGAGLDARQAVAGKAGTHLEGRGFLAVYSFGMGEGFLAALRLVLESRARNSRHVLLYSFQEHPW